VSDVTRRHIHREPPRFKRGRIRNVGPEQRSGISDLVRPDYSTATTTQPGIRRKSCAFAVSTVKPWRIAVAPMIRSRTQSVTPRPSELTRCAWTRATSRSNGSGRNNLKIASTNAERRARRCSVLARCTPTRSSEHVAADMNPTPYSASYREKSTAPESFSILINTLVSMINPIR